MSNIDSGNYGERIAEEYLLSHNYTILERKYRCRFGEIDIIAGYGGYVVFVEVKYRRNLNCGYPREAVTKAKQLKIKKTARFYIVAKELHRADFRFDVIEILDMEELQIEHIENAFW